SLLEAIEEERNLLTEIQSLANYTIDTSSMKPKELRKRIGDYFNKSNYQTFNINVTSFSFKHGISMDADLLFDVRFLPNQLYVHELRPLLGDDKSMYNYDM